MIRRPIFSIAIFFFVKVLLFLLEVLDMVTQQESETMSPVVLKEQAIFTIERMNDYCLLDVFTTKSIDLLDLCSVAKTCTRFKQICQRIVPKEFHFELREEVMYELEARKNNNKTKIAYNPTDIERIFINFGSLLAAVSFSKYQRYPDRQRKFNALFGLVVKHCNSLSSLKIMNHTINSYYQIKMAPILQPLQILKIKDVCMAYAIAAQFSGSSSLIELSVHNVKECGVILENVFPKLKRFTFVMYEIRIVKAIGDIYPAKELPINTLTTFISRHRMLKAISLVFDCDRTCKMNILQTISNKCKELEKLNIDIDTLPEQAMCLLQPLQTLKSLEKLTLWREICYDFQFLSTLEKLRELKFMACTLPKDSDPFCSVAQLTKLEIAGFHPLDGQSDGFQVGIIDVVGIISRLTNLENFNLESAPYFIGQCKFFDLRKHELSKIVRIVKDRPKILTLKCTCAFKVENCKNTQHQLRLMPIE